MCIRERAPAPLRGRLEGVLPAVPLLPPPVRALPSPTLRRSSAHCPSKTSLLGFKIY